MNWKLMNMSKLVMISTAILILSAHIASAQDFTVHMTDENGKSVATRYVTRNAVRNVATFPAETDMIYLLDKGTIITVDNKKKTYSEATLGEIKQMAAQKENAITPQQRELMHRMGYGGAISVTKVGPGETIAGYATEKYAVKGATYQGEVLVAPSLDPPPGYYDMVTAYTSSVAGGMGLVIKELREKQIKGYLLKSTGTVSFSPMMKGVSYTEVASSIEKHPIPASTFDPPAGYQKVARPY
jgi:hypothetical protein